MNILFKPQAEKDLAALQKAEQVRIMRKISALQNGLSGDIKRLTNFTPEYRLRIGDYRILFEQTGDTAVIYRVIHRREAYR